MDYSALSQKEEIKYQVFVSSPFSEAETRSVVFDAIQTTGHIPVLMESFSPGNDRTKYLVNRTINESQIYILILGHRYGTIMNSDNSKKDNSSEISYTEYEYVIAKDSNIKMVVFLQDKDEINKERQKLEQQSDEILNSNKFWSFYNRIKNSGDFYAIWSKNNLEGLAARVTTAIHKEADRLSNEPNLKGWVRASNIDISTILPTIKNELRRGIVERFNTFTLLDLRCSLHIEEKQALASLFRDVFSEFILKKRIDIFLDSGSTVAYVAKELGEEWTLSNLDVDGTPITYISTNNALAYLQLWLRYRVPCTLFPSGSPEEPYGAVYGPLSDFGLYRGRKTPHYGRKKLSDDAKDRIRRLRNINMRPESLKERKLLIIGQVSGIQISSDPILLPDDIDKNTQNNLIRLRGFHVGDYYNMLFKRYLCKLPHPIIFCIDFDKVNMPIKVGECHFVFDEEFAWDSFITECPVAFCVGCKATKQDEAIKIFESIGMKLYQEPTISHYNPHIVGFIVTNEQFRKDLGFNLDNEDLTTRCT